MGKDRDDITKFLNEITDAETVRDNADEQYGYSDSQRLYEGDFATVFKSFPKNTPLIPINEPYAYVKAFIPTVYSRDPRISVNPKGNRHVGGAKMLELALNAYWRDLRLKRQVRRCIMDAIFAEGIMKVGFSATFGSIEKEDNSPNLEESEFIRDEEVFAIRIPWRNFVRDKHAVDGLHDARWVAQKIIKPLAAVKASRIYENTKDLKANFVTEPTVNNRRPKQIGVRGQASAPLQEMVTMWERWDMDTEEVYTLVEGHDKFLLKRPWPYGMDGYPFCLLRFNDNPDEPYAPNCIWPWIPQLAEKVKIRSLMMDHLKRFNRQLFVEEGAMKPQEKAKFKDGNMGAIIETRQGKAPPAPVPYPQIQTDIYAIENRVDLDKDNISGQPNVVRSAPQKTQSRTLGELDRMISTFQSRQGDPQSLVEDFCADVGYKLIAVIKEHLPGEKFIRATQEDARAVIQAFGPDVFDGTGFNATKEGIKDVEFDLEVKSGSTLPLDRQNRMSEMVSVVKLGPYIGIQPGDEVSTVIGKNMLSEFELKEVEIAYNKKIAQLEAQRAVARTAAMARADMTISRVDQIKAQSDRLDAEAQLQGVMGGM